MAAIEPEKYTVYVDSMVMAMEHYYDTTRVPFGYQAYPVQFGKVDRYYDDNGLVGIDYIDSYLVTKNPHYLEKAKQVLTFGTHGLRRLRLYARICILTILVLCYKQL